MSETKPELIERMKLRAKLIEALESGNFRQIRGFYRRGWLFKRPAYCFIGLAYHLMGGRDYSNECLKDAVKEAYGFRDINLMIDLNDGQYGTKVKRALFTTSLPPDGLSFPEIAKLLKERPYTFYKG